MKRLRSMEEALDAIDRALLHALAANARASMAELAREVGLSAPSTAERVRRLEESGVIQGYTVVVDPAALGLPLGALLRIRPLPGQLQQTAKAIQQMASVVECDRVTGDDCFVARAWVRDVTALETTIDAINALAATNTSVLQSSPVPRRLPGASAWGAPSVSA